VVSQKTVTTGTAFRKARTTRLPVSRAVLWTGIALGVFLATEAVLHGLVLPLSLGLLADAALTFLLIVALAVVLAELTRRHHRTVAGHAARHGRRAIGYGRRRSAAGTRIALAWLAAKVGPRWERRLHQPLLFRRIRGEPEVPAVAGHPEEAAGPTYSFGHAGQRAAWPVDSLEEATARARQMSGGGEPYVVTEYPAGGGPGRTVATYVYGKPSQPSTEGSKSMPASKISTGHRAQRAARSGDGNVPSQWGPVVAQAADFEPESDGHLLEWMAGQVTGMAAYAEALIEAYETGVGAVGIDPKGLAALHDVADAAAHAAETMSGARTKFADHYELPREFAANGGLMTHDGRWITGEGA
jgi:hypothetical protein